MPKKTKKDNQENKKQTSKQHFQSSDTKNIVWVFDNIDKGGKFAFDLSREDFNHQLVLEKIIDYSSMTWSQIKQQTHDNNKSKNHEISVSKLSSEAKKRIKEKQLDEDTDSIFSIALQNKIRIIGIREDEKFHVLWYDPKHEVCPSKKKHT